MRALGIFKEKNISSIVVDLLLLHRFGKKKYSDSNSTLDQSSMSFHKDLFVSIINKYHD